MCRGHSDPSSPVAGRTCSLTTAAPGVSGGTLRDHWPTTDKQLVGDILLCKAMTHEHDLNDIVTTLSSTMDFPGLQ